MGRAKGTTGIAAVAFAAVLSVVLFVSATGVQDEPETKAVALIVNPENTTRNVTFSQLRGYLRLDRRFWPDKSRVVLFLPRADSDVKKTLNEEVYGMTEKKLRKYWTGKVFSGDIPSVPQVVKTSEAAGRLVAGAKGAISAVPADDVPAGVRVLSVDGKKPGEKGYPLVYQVEASTEFR